MTRILADREALATPSSQVCLIINLTSAAQRVGSITAYHNPPAIIDRPHHRHSQYQHTASELENSVAHKLLITVWCSYAKVSFYLLLLFTLCLVPSHEREASREKVYTLLTQERFLIVLNCFLSSLLCYLT